MNTRFWAIAYAVLYGALPTPAAVADDLIVPGQYPSIQSALDAATDADTIHVAPGTYNESLNFLGKSVRLLSDAGASQTTIDGVGGPVIVAAPDSEIAGFTITGRNTASGQTIQAIGANLWLHDNIIENNIATQPGLWLNGASPVIERNIFRHNACGTQSFDAVIALANFSEPVIRNNVFHDNQCRGIVVTVPFGLTVQIVNNVFANNRTAIRHQAFGAIDDHYFANNILIGNDVGLRSNAPTTDFWRHNLLWQNDLDYELVADLTGVNGNLSADPLFVDAASADFHLLTGSPAIDVGTAELAPPDDIDGQIRPIDGDGDGTALYDIGVDEYSTPLGPYPAGTTVFVAAANPAPGTGSEQDPFRSIQVAIDSAQAGDTVGVAAGTYLENVILRPRIDLVGLGAESTTIDAQDGASTIVCADQVLLAGFTLTGSSERTIDCSYGANMIIADNLLTGNANVEIYLGGSASVIRDNVIDASAAAGNVGFSDAIRALGSFVTIEGNRIDVSRPGLSISAIDLLYPGPTETDGFIIRRNVIIGRVFVSNLQADANAGAVISDNLFLTGNGFSSAINVAFSYFGTILNNTIVDGGGIFLQGGDDTVGTIVNNILYGTADIESCGNDDNYVGNNNVYSPSPNRGCVPVIIGQNGNVSVDPLFVAPQELNFSLQSASPMIDAGDTLAPDLATIDLAGAARIAGLAVDIGALEFQAFDFDGDGVFDNQDNCSTVINPAQIDSNGDGYGNRCDPDLNNDGIVNVQDLALLKLRFFTGAGGPGWDAAADFNLDEVVNFADLGVLRSYFFGPPGPSGTN